MGNTQTTATYSLPASANPLYVGWDGTSVVYRSLDYIERFVVKDGIGGTPVVDIDFTSATPGSTSFVESSANARTVNLISPMPTKITNVVNSQPVVRFDGQNNNLGRFAVGDPSPFTVVVIGRLRTASPGVIFGGFANNVYWCVGSTGTATNLRFGGNSGGTNLTLSPIDMTQWHLYRCYYGGASSSVLAVDESTTTSGVITLIGAAGVEMASPNGSGFAYPADIGYAAIFYGDVTQSALWSTFKTWVTNKYGITLA